MRNPNVAKSNIISVRKKNIFLRKCIELLSIKYYSLTLNCFITINHIQFLN